MKEILLINPTKKKAPKKRKTPKKRPPAKKQAKRETPKGAKSMPAKKKPGPKKGSKQKKKRKSNPGARKAYSRARSAFGGLNFKAALKNTPAIQIGMFASKWAAKRFSDEYDAVEDDPESWNYASYLKGGLGATVAALICQMIRPGMGQKVLEGGINLMMFKVIENELIPQSDWASEQFGQDDQVVYDEQGTPYMLGQGGYYPVDERHRLPEEGLEDAFEPIGPLGQAQLEPVGRLGKDDPWAAAFLGEGGAADPFVQAYM